MQQYDLHIIIANKQKGCVPSWLSRPFVSPSDI